MSKVLIIQKKHLLLSGALLLLLVGALLFFNREKVLPANDMVKGPRIIHMVTGEFKTKTADGGEIEAYRWDPGTIFVRQGELVTLDIYGVNGDNHPFIIEGLDVKGEVNKGKETLITFRPEEEGIYRIICLTHPDITHSGPMIGYIVVD